MEKERMLAIQKNDLLIISEGKDMMVEAMTKFTSLASKIMFPIH